MCYGNNLCQLKLLHVDPECSSAISSRCAEARSVSGRDVVLGAAVCSSPLGGKMSSALHRPSPSATTTATSVTSAAAVTTSHFVAFSAADAAACTIGSEVGITAATSFAAQKNAVEPAISEAPISILSSAAHEIHSSRDSKSLHETLTASHDTANTSGLIFTTATIETSSDALGDKVGPTLLSSHTLNLSNQPLSNDNLSHSQTPTTVSLIGHSSLLVPSVCWKLVEESLVPHTMSSGSTGQYAASPSNMAADVGSRPPVLGEEERIGQEEELSQQEMLIINDGWGEYPAVVGSGEEESPDDCGGSGGVGSLEWSSGGSSTSSNPVEWAHSLDKLLADPVGASVYMQFLKEESGCSYSLDFYFACKGLGIQSPENLRQLLPLIWKKFIRNYNVPVSSKTHALIAEKIHSNAFAADMFKAAQCEVFNRMRDTTYQAFLQSQYYVNQLQQHHQDQQKLDSRGRLEEHQQYGYHSNPLVHDVLHTEVGYYPAYSGDPSCLCHDSPGFPAVSETYSDNIPSLNRSGSWVMSNPVLSRSGLATVYEHESIPSASSAAVSDSTIMARVRRGAFDLAQNKPNQGMRADPHSSPFGSQGNKRLNLTPGALAATVGQRATPLPKPSSRCGVNPYHASYGRGHYTSRQESEGHSISSGAHTDDTRSCTDSSLDGNGSHRNNNNSKQNRAQRALMKESLRLNEELQQQPCNILSPRGPLVVPRTQRQPCPDSSNIARHPAQFARLLSDKLRAVQQDRDAQDRIKQAFRKIQESNGSADVYRREHAVNSLPPSLLINKIMQKIPMDDDDSGQAILDQHVSRVWQDSNNGSPAYPPSTPPHPVSCYPYSAPPASVGGLGDAPSLSHNTNAAGHANKSGGSNVNKNAAQGYLHQHHCQHQPVLYQQQQQHLLQHMKPKGEHQQLLQYPAAAPTPYFTATAMPTSKSWHQARYREHKGRDVHSTFSTDSGNVADCNEAAHHCNTRHGMPKARSMPDHIMETCAGGSGSSVERYSHSSRGGRGAAAGSGGATDQTDSGVSVLYDSQQSLLTASNASSVKQRVETWLADTSESSSRSAVLLHDDVERTQQHGRRAPSSLSGGGGKRQGSCGGVQDPRLEHIRRRHRGGSTGGGADYSGRPATAAMGKTTTCMGGDTASSTTNIGGSGGGGNSDRHTISSSNGSTMRKQHKSAKFGGGCSDSQSSCGRTSNETPVTGALSGHESTTVVYSFCDDSVPFVIKIPALSVTLKRFKHHLPKKGNYRFFFKKHCEEFGEIGVVQEEMTEDDEVLPMFEGRIFAQIRKAD